MEADLATRESDRLHSIVILQAAELWIASGDWLGWSALYTSDVVLETRVLVSRRLEDKDESLGIGS